MALSGMVSRNFSAAELVNASRGQSIPAALESNALRMVTLLQEVRDLLGVSVRLTSFYREGDPNQHGRASAADFYADGIPEVEVGRRIIAGRASGQVGAYGQLIVYPYTTHHVHLSLLEPQISPVNRNLVKIRDGYGRWDGGALPPFDGGAVMDSTAPAPDTERAALSLETVATLAAAAALVKGF